jgi:hypothetical protein
MRKASAVAWLEEIQRTFFGGNNDYSGEFGFSYRGYSNSDFMRGFSIVARQASTSYNESGRI